jgi:hypothetical protein
MAFRLSNFINCAETRSKDGCSNVRFYQVAMLLPYQFYGVPGDSLTLRPKLELAVNSPVNGAWTKKISV